ncbi:NAD(P)/FAD-dependent oxidoreductase [Candidatus Stoquefichus massiliensis]|uniref:NAD(P)/FAD-dependent oxidoreductase n=1 Tax=Candidatus Stoquefichus massiliensis TaxID=1470350 RepID=UPI00048A0487|nr:NAD(P)/FAD-dependent oxidoreductase [Candidatus Stoquefichus massiliensis]
MKDIVIIGCGITGSLMAYELSKYQLDVAVLEKNNDVALESTGANSAIVHSGHDPKPNTLKARFNLEGNRMFPDLCKELQVDYQQIGAFVVSTSQEESLTLDRLEQQAKERRIPYARLNREDILAEEPHIGDGVTEALSLPTTGIITPWKVTIAAMEEAMENGVALYLNHEVKGIKHIKDGYRIFTIYESFDAKMVINAAGVYADTIAGYLEDVAYQITPRRGEYYILGKLTEPIVNHIIYPVPSSRGKGVLVVPTIHGNVLLGPNSEPISDKEDVSTTDALNEVKKNVIKTVKDIPFQKIIRTFSGLRPTGNTGDFVIEEDENHSNFIHVSCIESPGLTASPAIAKYIKDTFVAQKFQLIKKESYQKRRPDIVCAHLSHKERNQLIQKDSRFGKIICRCEQISEGEIIDVIHRYAGATTIDGVKKRCRPGMGGCQGGFCSPEVLAILARELHKDKQSIEYKGKHTEILPAKAKEAL